MAASKAGESSRPEPREETWQVRFRGVESAVVAKCALAGWMGATMISGRERDGDAVSAQEERLGNEESKRAERTL